MDRQINKSIENLKKSEEEVKQNKVNLQISFNDIIDDLNNEKNEINESISSSNDKIISLTEKIKNLESKKNEIAKLINENNNLIENSNNKIKNIEKLIFENNDKISNNEKKQQDCYAFIEQNKSEINQLNDEESNILNEIKELNDFNEIEKEINNYKPKINELNEKKSSINESLEKKQLELSNYEKEILIFEKNNESYNNELNELVDSIQNYKSSITANNNEFEEVEKEIEELNHSLSECKNDIGVNNQEITKKNQEIEDYKTKQAKYLKYPEFERISDIDNLLLDGNPIQYKKVLNSLKTEYSYFNFKSKPDFANSIDEREISPFLRNTSKTVEDNNFKSIFKNHEYKKIADNVYEYFDKDENPLFLVKKRDDETIWQILYFSEEEEKNEKTIIKVDVYDHNKNLRYTEYPNYSNGKIVGKQEHWFDENNFVYLICQKYDGTEKYQLFNEDGSIFKVVTGIDELYSYWLDNIKNDYSILTKLDNDEEILEIDNTFVFIRKNEPLLDNDLIDKINTQKTLVFEDTSDAQIYYWNNIDSLIKIL